MIAANATSHSRANHKQSCAWPATRRSPRTGRPACAFTGDGRTPQNRIATIAMAITRGEAAISFSSIVKRSIMSPRTFHCEMRMFHCRVGAVTQEQRSSATLPRDAWAATRRLNRTKAISERVATSVTTRRNGTASNRSIMRRPNFHSGMPIAPCRVSPVTVERSTRGSGRSA